METANLCSSCSIIPLETLCLPNAADIEELKHQGKAESSGYFQRDRDKNLVKVPLGSLRRILLNEDICELCALIGSILVQQEGSPSYERYDGLTVNGKDLDCQARSDYYGQFFHPTNPQEYYVTNRLSIFTKESPEGSLGAHSCFQVCDNDNVFTEVEGMLPNPQDYSHVQLFGGRRRPLQLNLRWVAKWMEICDKEHDGNCLRPLDELNSGVQSFMTVRFVDVRRKCVAIFEDTTPANFQYVALSYVWGKSKQAVDLRSSNIDKLTTPGSLDTSQLSRTIADTIILAERLGIPYVWVARYTSWPKDRAIISGLLMDIELPSDSRGDILQQDTYRRILMKIRKTHKISPGHLFHSSATMSNVRWCPTNLFDIPTTDSEASIDVTDTLGLSGIWRRIPATRISEKDYNWRGIHPLIRGRLQLHLQDPECFLLSEYPTKPGDRSSTEPVDRALLVKESPQNTRPPCYEYIGAVYFHPDRTKEYFSEGVDEVVELVGGGLIAEPDGKKRATTLCDAIWRGKADRGSIKINDADLIMSDEIGQRPLHFAAERGDKLMVRLLLEKTEEHPGKESILGARCKIGQTALHRAAWGGSAEVVKLLLEAGSMVGAKDNDGNLAIHIAAEKGFEPIVDELIKQEDCKAENWNKVTPLHYAAGSGDQETVELLLKSGAGFNAKDRVNWTPLHFAAMNGFKAVVELLQGKNACLDPKDKSGWTPRQFAELKKHTAVFELLPPYRDASTPINVSDKNRWTLLHFIAINEQQGIIKLLFDEDNSEENSNRIALSWAAWNGQEVFVRLLLENGAEIESYDYSGRTPLSSAARNGQEAVVRLLLENGAVIESYDYSGRTPQLWAAENGQVAIVQLLLEKGATINSWDKCWQTSLSLAAKNGQEAVVRLLLKRGADIELRDKYGQTPLSSAAENGQEAVVSYYDP